MSADVTACTSGDKRRKARIIPAKVNYTAKPIKIITLPFQFSYDV